MSSLAEPLQVDSKKITFKKWPIQSIEDNVIIMIIGKRGSGKTTFLMNLLYHMRNRFDVGMAITPTKDTAQEFKKHMCDSFIYDNMKDADEVISLITDLQGVFAEDEPNGQPSRPRNIYLIADDCFFDKKSFKTTNMRDILFNGRHYGVCWINTAQYLMDIDTSYRSQIDYVIIVGEPTPDTRDKLWENFFKSVFENTTEGRRLFYLTLKKCTQDHNCLILNNKTHKNDSITDRIFFYKGVPAEQLPPFKLDKPVYRKMHKDTYIPAQVRLDKKKQEIMAKSMRKVSGITQSIVELEGVKGKNGRGRGRGRGRGAPTRVPVSTRRLPSARPKLPPYRSTSTRTRVSSRTARTAHTSRTAKTARTSKSDIKTNVTYRNSEAPSRASSRRERSRSPARSDASMSMLSSSFMVPPPPITKCRGGVCGREPEIVQGRRNR